MPAGDPAAYWRERVRRLGAHAVLSTDHAGSDPAMVTAAHQAALLPVLARQLDGSERTLLDLGCGRGRLTLALAQAIGGRAIGVDPVAEQLAAAPVSSAVEYRRGLATELPLADGEVDVVFTCLVLGGLTDTGLGQSAAEIRRVLRPGGLLLLAESVSAQADLAHWHFRSLAAYRAAFSWARLEQAGRFDDAGDAVAILAGRRQLS